jgi:biotin synthase-related radical SAM superfamily protein
MKLLEFNKEPNKLSFHGKIINLEFVGKIGNINIYGDPGKRDKMLLKLGKRNLKNTEPSKPKKIIHGEVLSHEEIFRLLHIGCPEYLSISGERPYYEKLFGKEKLDALLAEINKEAVSDESLNYP